MAESTPLLAFARLKEGGGVGRAPSTKRPTSSRPSQGQSRLVRPNCAGFPEKIRGVSTYFLIIPDNEERIAGFPPTAATSKKTAYLPRNYRINLIIFVDAGFWPLA